MGTDHTRPIHVLVGGWVAANGVLAGLLFIFHPEAISLALYYAAVLILAGFGLAVLVAARRGRFGVQRRIPVRGSSAVLVAVGLLLVGLGLLYGWVLALVGLAPLLAGAVQAGRERLGAGARPWPLVPDGTPAAEPPAHQSSMAAPERPVGVVKAAGLGVVATRTLRTLLRRPGRG